MARPVYVEIPKSAGDWRVTTGEIDFSTIGSTVGDVLGFIPGVGNTLEKGADFIGRFFGGLFGTQKDEVRDVMRKILTEYWGAAFPGKLKMIGSARDVPELPDQFREQDIRRAMNEIGKTVLAGLAPGSDIHGDLSRAFRELQYNHQDTTGGYLMLKFYADPTAGQTRDPAPVRDDLGGDGFYRPPDPEPTRTTPDQRDADTTSGSGPYVEPGTVGGLSPVMLGIGAVVILLLVSR